MSGRLVVLVSGTGSNLAAIMTACAAGGLDAEVVGVVANKPAGGIDKADVAGIPTVVLAPERGESRSDYDRRLTAVVADFDPDLVVMAGWMRITTMAFLENFDVVNLHPALPGAYPGLHAIERAYDDWVAGDVDTAGVMVHWVPDEGVDDGPVIAERPVPFVEGDTLESFETRVHQIEHELIVEAIALALSHIGVNSAL
ncbi:MAG: phosphoribosylglycinamide formyltransferase [Acidimicrobiales bacterium]